MEQADALKAKGVQVVACLTVNDVFVTQEWARAHNAEGKVSCGSCRGSGATVEIFFCDFCFLLRFGSLQTPVGPLGR